ncbi:MAG: TIGR02300 family protein [Pseudomonadota bacterium]
MAKPEWGTKRTCPKCGERFYDLGKEDPVTCIECGEEWTPEPVLKTKQPIPFEPDDTKKKDGEADSDLGGDDDDELKDIENIDDDDDSPDNDVDLGGDDDLGVSKGKGDDEDEDN